MENTIDVTFDHFKKIRESIINSFAQLTVEEVYQFPTGFNNNLIWQAGHILATQQIFHYKLTGNTPRVDYQLIERYKKGTFAETQPDREELDLILNHLENTVEDLKSDFEKNRLNAFTEYTTGFGVKISNINEAIAFNNIHEALHLGRIASMKQILLNNADTKKPLPFS